MATHPNSTRSRTAGSRSGLLTPWSRARGVAAGLARFARRYSLPGLVLLTLAAGGVYLVLRAGEGMAEGERALPGRLEARGVLSPDGSTLALLRDDGAIEITPATGGRAIVIRGHGAPVVAARFSPEGDTLTTIDASGAKLTTHLGAQDSGAAGIREVAHGLSSPEAMQPLVWNAVTRDAWRTALALEHHWSPASAAGAILSPDVTAPVLAGGVAPAPGLMFRDCADCPQMVVVPAGAFTMGSPPDEEGRFDNEGPQREVTIAAPFAVGRFEITVAEFARFIAASGHVAADDCSAGSDLASWRNPGFVQTPDHPVLCVSWQDAQAYMSWLSRETGKTYRLLSEAEWEYAARAGTTTAYPWGRGASHESANYGTDDCCDGLALGRDQWVNTSPAGSFAANAFGLFDMHGNVFEWVEDCYAGNYSSGQPSNGGAYTSGACSYRVFRGGSWDYSPRFLRSAYRYWDAPTLRSRNLGFRVARTL